MRPVLPILLLATAAACVAPSGELDVMAKSGDWGSALPETTIFEFASIRSASPAQDDAHRCTADGCTPRLRVFDPQGTFEIELMYRGSLVPGASGSYPLGRVIRLTLPELRRLRYSLRGAAQAEVAAGAFSFGSQQVGELRGESHELSLRVFSTETRSITMTAECAIGRVLIYSGRDTDYEHLGPGETLSRELHVGDRIETYDGETYAIGAFSSEIPLSPAECEWDIQVLSARALPTSPAWDTWGTADPAVELTAAETTRSPWIAAPLFTRTTAGSGYDVEWTEENLVARDLRGSNLAALKFRILDEDLIFADLTMDTCEHQITQSDFSGDPIAIRCSERNSLLTFRLVPSAAP